MHNFILQRLEILVFD